MMVIHLWNMDSIGFLRDGTMFQYEFEELHRRFGTRAIATTNELL